MPIQYPEILVATLEIPVGVNLGVKIRIEPLRTNRAQQRRGYRQIERYQFAQRGRADEIVHIGDKVEVAPKFMRTAHALIAYTAKNIKPRRVPLVLAILFYPFGDVARVEFDRFIKMAYPRHPVAQDLFSLVSVVVGPNIEGDRGFRVIECLDAIEIERQRRFLLLRQDCNHHPWRIRHHNGAQRPLRHERMLLDEVLSAKGAEVRRLT